MLFKDKEYIDAIKRQNETYLLTQQLAESQYDAQIAMLNELVEDTDDDEKYVAINCEARNLRHAVIDSKRTQLDLLEANKRFNDACIASFEAEHEEPTVEPPVEEPVETRKKRGRPKKSSS